MESSCIGNGPDFKQCCHVNDGFGSVGLKMKLLGSVPSVAPTLSIWTLHGRHHKVTRNTGFGAKASGFISWSHCLSVASCTNGNHDLLHRPANQMSYYYLKKRLSSAWSIRRSQDLQDVIIISKSSSIFLALIFFILTISSFCLLQCCILKEITHTRECP